MRGTHSIDPARCSHGPATAAVQQVLSEWMAIDWFEPARAGADADATSSFEQHHRLARAHQPELFPEQLEVRTQLSGWAEFVELCARVRIQGWDWKFAALKQLSHRHSQARGWSLGKALPVATAPGQVPDSGDLFFRFGESVIWNDLAPKLDLQRMLAPGEVEAAAWYLGYATMDLIECIEWQLAEQSDRLGENPFFPLVRCYALGIYPFSLGPAEIVLFGFVSK